MNYKGFRRVFQRVMLGSSLFFYVLLAAFFAPVTAFAEPVTALPEPVTAPAEPKLSLAALSAVLIDAENGRVLYEKDGYQKRAMASTTKIMTLLVLLKYGNTDDVVTVSAYASKMPEVKLFMRQGEQYRFGDLLYSLMLESHNDTAVALAEHVAGDVEHFAALMNDTAREIGAYETHFVTPNGLDSEAHYSTAYDMALIAREALKNETFLRITNTPSYQFSTIDGKRNFFVRNRNAFLTQYDGAIGVKTGFTGNAGYCFVGAVKRGERTFIAVVLGCGWPPHKTYKWKDMRTLFDYAFAAYEHKTIYEPETLAAVIPVKHGIEKDAVSCYTNEQVSLNLGGEDTVEIRDSIPEVLTAPLAADTVVGSRQIYINGRFYRSVLVYTAEAVERENYRYYFFRVVRAFFQFTEARQPQESAARLIPSRGMGP